MRTSTVLAMVAVLLAVPACKNLQNMTPRTATGCVLTDGAPDACSNMLPQNWREDPAAVIALLADTSDQAKLKFTRKPVTKERQVDIDCRAIQGSPNKKLELIYDIPAAMANFPVDGTNGRELIVAQFKISKSDKCREARYGILDPPGAGNSKVYYYIAVKTVKAYPLHVNYNRMIGEWTVRRIYEKNGSLVSEDLRTGAYIQCADEHDSTYGDVGFAACMPAPKLRTSVMPGLLDRFFTIPSANASAVLGSVTAVQDGFEAETDPAWGRCGALGCCASY